MQVTSVHHEYGRLTLATAGLLVGNITPFYHQQAVLITFYLCFAVGSMTRGVSGL